MRPVIYIPTHRRVDRQRTARWIPSGWDVRLVAPPDEVEPLRGRGWNAVPCPAQGISLKRQWILDQHDIARHGPRLIMMDDDLRFFRRRTDTPTKLLTISPDPTEMNGLLTALIALWDRAPLIGLANRSGANRQTEPLRWNCRMHDVLGVDVKVAQENGFRFDRIPLMEDFDFILQHLTKGHQTVMLNDYCKDDDGSQSHGGCSTYRTPSLQAAAAADLTLMWPDFVRLRTVRAKQDGMWGERVDVTVQWAKAAKAGAVR